VVSCTALSIGETKPVSNTPKTLLPKICQNFLGYADAAFISPHKSVRGALENEYWYPGEASGQKLTFLAVDHFPKWEILAQPESPALGSASLGTTMTGLQLSCSPFWEKKEEAPTMHRSLSFDANLEAIQKEARTLLRALQRNDVAAIERYRPYEVLDDASHPRLADAQYIIARRYGFRSWANLKGLLIHSKH